LLALTGASILGLVIAWLTIELTSSGFAAPVLSAVGRLTALTFSLHVSPDLLLTWHWLVVLAVFVAALCFMLPRSGATPLQVLREVLVLVPAYLLYSTVRGLVAGRQPEAFMRAMHLIRLETALGEAIPSMARVVGAEKILRALTSLTHTAGLSTLIGLADSAYVVGTWLAIILAGIWLFVAHRDSYPAFRNAWLLSFPISPVVMGALAVAPSRLLSWNVLICIAIVRHAQRGGPKTVGLLWCMLAFTVVLATGNDVVAVGIASSAVAVVGLTIAMVLDGEFRNEHGKTMRQAQTTN